MNINKKIKAVLLPLLLVTVLALFSFYGCGVGGATQTMTGAAPAPAAGGESFSQQELQQILNDSLTKYDALNTYRFNMDMEILVDTIGGTQAGKMTMSTKTTGATLVNTNETQMNTEASIGVEGTVDQNGSQELTYDMYLMKEWIYMRVEVPGMGEQWIKMPVTDEAMESLNTDAIDQQLGPLEDAVKIDYLRSEVVDGQDCYVLGITPDMKAIANWLGEQDTGANADWQDLVNYSDVFKEFSYVCYIVKETNYLKRVILNMVMGYTAEQAGASAGDFDKMIMNIATDMKLYDHNASITITLPDEALDAMEVSEDAFSK